MKNNKLGINVQLTWIEFEELLQESSQDQQALILLQKLFRITGDLEERKKLFYALIKSVNKDTGNFNVPRFKMLLKQLGIKHLEGKVIKPGVVK